MNINYTLKKDQYINFLDEHFHETSNYKYFGIIRPYMCIISAIIITIFILDIPSILLLSNGSIVILVLIALIIFSIIRKKLISYFVKLKLNKAFSLGKYDYLFKDTTVTLNKSDINYSNDLIEVNFTWNVLKNICVFDDYIFIVSKSTQNILIPCNVFKNESDKESFLKHIINSTIIKPQNSFPKDFILFIK